MIAATKRAEMIPRLLTEKEAMAYVRMGRTHFRSWAEAIGAKRKIGRSARFDRLVIDKELDKMGGQDPEENEPCLSRTPYTARPRED